MSNTELPKVGSRILVHNPDGISRGDYKVKHGDVAKVVGYLEFNKVLAFNPEWENKPRPISRGFSRNYTYRGPCVVLMPYEYKVVP